MGAYRGRAAMHAPILCTPWSKLLPALEHLGAGLRRGEAGL